MSSTIVIGISAGILTSISSLPQIIKASRTKETGDVSVIMFAILIIGVGLWVVYGFQKNDMPIIITNFLGLFLNSTMLILKFIYGKNK